MNEAVIGLAAVGGAGLAAAFVLWSVIPLLTQLRRMSGEAELLLRHLNGELPALVKQATHTLKNLDGTLIENLPNLVSRTTDTLHLLDGLSAELPGLITEATHSVRNANKRGS